MILKQKHDVRLIFVNDKYYLKTSKYLYHFDTNYNEALEYYDNIIEIEKNGPLKFIDGKFRIELYPDELLDILKALEVFKFTVDKSLYFNCNFDSLKAKSYDLELLGDFLFCFYYNYLQQVKESAGDSKISDNILNFSFGRFKDNMI